MERIRELLKSLSESGIESPHLDRLRARTRAQAARSGLASVEREILGEMAAALGHAETLIDEALLRCELLGRRIDALEQRRSAGESVQAELARAIDEFNGARDTAQRRLWELTVHREALGLRRHELLDELYPIPARRVSGR